MAFYQWSKTSASNGTSDPTINMQEGMPPAQLNDGVRAAMARLAEYRDDTSGLLTTGGTGTAYTISTNQGFASLALMNGAKLKMRFHVDCGNNPTLNVDGQGAISLFTGNISGVAYGVPPGTIREGTVWEVFYDNSIPAFVLSGGLSTIAVPVGAIMDYAGIAAPALWLLCAGQSVSTTTFAALFSVLGYSYGGGGSSFAIPDYRGRVTAGKDDMGGSAAGRIGTVATDSGTIVGTTLGSTGGSSAHIQTQSEMAQHSHSGSGNVSDPTHTHPQQSNTSLTSAGGVSNLASTNPTGLTGGTTGASATGISVPSLNINNAGSSSPMAWLQPTIIANKIIFAGV